MIAAGESFAFTIFDDPDSQTLEAGREVYTLLADLGFRTTKGVVQAESAGPINHRTTAALVPNHPTEPGRKNYSARDLKSGCADERAHFRTPAD